jgi:hypothetical protein
MLNLGNVAGFLGSFALSLFLLANFAIILDLKTKRNSSLPMMVRVICRNPFRWM